jgi:hypothetical protein
MTESPENLAASAVDEQYLLADGPRAFGDPEADDAVSGASWG